MVYFKGKNKKGAMEYLSIMKGKQSLYRGKLSLSKSSP
jgi:hypothetical protein